jgi:hypothetical protein
LVAVLGTLGLGLLHSAAHAQIGMPRGPAAVAAPQQYHAASPRVAQQPAGRTATYVEPVEGMYSPEPLDGGAACGVDECTYGIASEPCGERMWFRGEYLMWWSNSSSLPPMVTTSPLDTPRDEAGILGLPGTNILYGGDNVDPGMQSGGRFSLGWWFDGCSNEGFEVTYLFLGKGVSQFEGTSDEYPILGVPYYDAEVFDNDALLFAFPAQQVGGLNVRLTSELYSLEALFRRCTSAQVDFVYGYRYARLSEQLHVNGSSTFTSSVGGVLVGTQVDVFDAFDATNDFHGFEFGFVARRQSCRWSVEAQAKLALGGTRSKLNVLGGTTVAVPGTPTLAYPGGIFALPTNMGEGERSGFTVIPELGLTVGYCLSPRLNATMGYTFLYWSRVVRPADQVDTALNGSQFPPGSLAGFPSPRRQFVTSDYWAQGLNFGLEYRF